MHSCVRVDRDKNKAGYMATLFACGWTGAVMKLANQAVGQEQ